MKSRGSQKVGNLHRSLTVENNQMRLSKEVNSSRWDDYTGGKFTKITDLLKKADKNGNNSQSPDAFQTMNKYVNESFEQSPKNSIGAEVTTKDRNALCKSMQVEANAKFYKQVQAVFRAQAGSAC